MIEIPLTRYNHKTIIKTAIIDDIDKDLCDLKWHILHENLKWYAIHNCVKYHTSIRLHRIILRRILGHELMPNEMVFHKDGNTLNNMRNNIMLKTKR